MCQEVSRPPASREGQVREVGNEMRKEVGAQVECLSGRLEPRAGPLTHTVSDGQLYSDRASESSTPHPHWLCNVACKMTPTYVK